MNNMYGQIDLTILGDFVRNHPDAVKRVHFNSDGRDHQLINVNLYENREPDKNGNTHALKISLAKEKQLQGEKLYCANLKPSQQQASAPAAPAPAPAEDNGGLPF